MPKKPRDIKRRKADNERQEIQRSVRYSEEEYETILDAAGRLGESYAEFVRKAALDRAHGLTI